MHRTTSNYQQQSGVYQYQQPVYNIGAPPAASFMSHPPNLFVNHSFTRSFASVVSSDSDLTKHQNMGNKLNCARSEQNNTGLLGSLFKHFNKPPPPQYQPSTMQQHKEFEDFTNMPSMNNNHQLNFSIPQQQHYYQHPPTTHINMPLISGPAYYQAHCPSANNTNNTMTAATRNFMASFFSGYQQRQPQQPPPKPKNQRWFNRGFRCRGGRGRNGYNNNGNKFHDHDVNLPKNLHEKERSSIERDIQDDSCDFVHVVQDKDVVSDKKVSTNNPNETAKGSCGPVGAEDDPPFMIYSLEEFPAIVCTSNSVEVKSPTASPPAKRLETEKSNEGFVLLPASTSTSTPSFTPKRLSLCEQIIRSPQKLFPKLPLKPCLKPSRRTVSECSDDFVVFADVSNEYPTQDITFCDTDDSESDDEDDDDSIIFEGEEMTDVQEEYDNESSDEDDEVDSPEHQPDSGVEEKKVSCVNILSSGNFLIICLF